MLRIFGIWSVAKFSNSVKLYWETKIFVLKKICTSFWVDVIERYKQDKDGVSLLVVEEVGNIINGCEWRIDNIFKNIM